jgi:hypothetical protein
MYRGEYTTMSMLVSSHPPEKAGLQIVLAETLLDFGASIESLGSKKWGSPLLTALAFGYLKTAEGLPIRGARVDSLPAAAGLGRLFNSPRITFIKDESLQPCMNRSPFLPARCTANLLSLDGFANTPRTLTVCVSLFSPQSASSIGNAAVGDKFDFSLETTVPIKTTVSGVNASQSL